VAKQSPARFRVALDQSLDLLLTLPQLTRVPLSQFAVHPRLLAR
jgi:hypothetical protein